MVETSVTVNGKEIIVTWDTGEAEVHMAIDMVDLTLGWAKHWKGEFTASQVVFLPVGLLAVLAEIGVVSPALTHDC